MATDKKELWVGWTRDALARYDRPESTEDVDDLLNDMVDVTTGYADMMLDEFEERFAGGTAPSRPARKRRERGEGKE